VYHASDALETGALREGHLKWYACILYIFIQYATRYFSSPSSCICSASSIQSLPCPGRKYFYASILNESIFAGWGDSKRVFSECVLLEKLDLRPEAECRKA
jgi:hypothetical protein